MAGRLLAGHGPCEIVGQSSGAAGLRAQIARVAPFASNVLITGPSGTGKELVARRIHALSPRRERPFVPVDCASMTGELMSSQLFGHVAGAFTGANCDALGCFRAADHGTIFLDEIGELDFPLQSKLLRVLQERVVTPIGSHRGEPADVRVVAATNRDLREEVRAGRFREDLYYRLHVIHLQTRPLREHAEDIPPLAETFLKQLAAEGLPRCSLSPGAVGELTAFSWPGNVRQLRNVLEQAVIEADEPELGHAQIARLLADELCGGDDGVARVADSLGSRPIHDRWPRPAPEAASNLPPTASPTTWPTFAMVEREHLLRTLEHTFYNRSAAARLLGITRQSLLRKMERYQIQAPGQRER
jgi:DNA-binding NtrC family response regulator